jgi:hypothetical protein
MDKNPFLSLSQELIFAICEEVSCFIYIRCEKKTPLFKLFSQLDMDDLKHMRLACKNLATDVASLVLSHISIPAIEVTTIEEVVSDLQFLAKAAGNCARKIVIDDFLSVFYEDEELECNIDNVALDHAKSLGQDILAALTSFNIVRTVKYTTLLNHRSFLLIYLVGTQGKTIHFGYKRLSGTRSGYFQTSVI